MTTEETHADRHKYVCMHEQAQHPRQEKLLSPYLESVKHNQTFIFIATYCITIHHGMIYINRCINTRFFHLPHQCLSSIHIASLAEKFKAKDKKHREIGNKEFLQACILFTYNILKKTCKRECCANCQWVLAQIAPLLLKEQGGG